MLAIIVVGVIVFIILIIVKKKEDSSSNNSLVCSSVSQQSTYPTRSGYANPYASTYNKATDSSELYSLKAKYTLNNTASDIFFDDPLQQELKSYTNIAVYICVKKILNQRRDWIKEIKSLKKENDYILDCPGCNSDKDKVAYIKNRIEELEQNKTYYSELSSKIQQNQIALVSGGNEAFNKLRSGFSDICACKKSYSKSKVPLSSVIMIKTIIPGELFSSPCNSIKLNFGAYKFFLLPDVILAFTKENNFAAALEPAALEISFRNQLKQVFLSRRQGTDTWTNTDEIIADDSALVTEGTIRTKWLHQRVNGERDLRYSYNPIIEYRIDTYAFTDFSIRIGKFKADYSLSKSNILNELKPKMQEYCLITHDSSRIPSLLRLLKITAKNGEEAQLLSEKYESVRNDITCRINQENY